MRGSTLPLRLTALSTPQFRVGQQDAAGSGHTLSCVTVHGPRYHSTSRNLLASSVGSVLLGQVVLGIRKHARKDVCYCPVHGVAACGPHPRGCRRRSGRPRPPRATSFPDNWPSVTAAAVMFSASRHRAEAQRTWTDMLGPGQGHSREPEGTCVRRKPCRAGARSRSGHGQTSALCALMPFLNQGWSAVVCQRKSLGAGFRTAGRDCGCKNEKLYAHGHAEAGRELHGQGAGLRTRTLSLPTCASNSSVLTGGY